MCMNSIEEKCFNQDIVSKWNMRETLKSWSTDALNNISSKLHISYSAFYSYLLRSTYVCEMYIYFCV